MCQCPWSKANSGSNIRFQNVRVSEPIPEWPHPEDADPRSAPGRLLGIVAQKLVRQSKILPKVCPHLWKKRFLYATTQYKIWSRSSIAIITVSQTRNYPSGRVFTQPPYLSHRPVSVCRGHGRKPPRGTAATSEQLVVPGDGRLTTAPTTSGVVHFQTTRRWRLGRCVEVASTGVVSTGCPIDP